MPGKAENNWILQLINREKAGELMEYLCYGADGSTLNSLLLEVFHQRLNKETPANLLHRYKNNRLVQPSSADPLALRRMELSFLEFAAAKGITLLELSTAAALGSCSVIAAVHQHKILTSLRQAEVLADATNSLALHDAATADRSAVRHYGTTARMLRTPLSPVKEHTPHFLAGCLVSAAPDKGDFIFEQHTLLLHLQLLAQFLEKAETPVVRFKLITHYNTPDHGRLAKACLEFLSKNLNVHVELIIAGHNHDYYKGCQFKVCINVNGYEIEIADGGFVNWAALLCQDNKQRMLISGLGLEYLYHLSAPDAQRKSHI